MTGNENLFHLNKICHLFPVTTVCKLHSKNFQTFNEVSWVFNPKLFASYVENMIVSWSFPYICMCMLNCTVMHNYFSTFTSPSAVKFQLPTRGTREDFMYNGSFHEAVGIILAVAQFFGVMPVGGIRNKLPSSLKFRKFSFRFAFCILCIIAIAWIFVLDCIWLFGSKAEFDKIVNAVFDSTNMISLICFLKLATEWPRLMKKWSEVEKFLPELRCQMDKQKMAYEIKMVSIVIASMSLGRFDFFFKK